MVSDLLTLLAMVIMASVISYAIGYHDGHKYGRRR